MSKVRRVWFITHPQIMVDPHVAVTDWSLSEIGRGRMSRFVHAPELERVGSIWCSTERKAIEAAEILGAHLGQPCRQWAALGENDRSSTGYLPRAAFEAMADRFFAEPEQSVRGWERAVDAQARIVGAVAEVVKRSEGDDEIAIVAHGAVGALLLCHLEQAPIARLWDQPGEGGGNFFVFAGGTLLQGWTAIDG
jgi:broad specificity phosphatase PhoE